MSIFCVVCVVKYLTKTYSTHTRPITCLLMHVCNTLNSDHCTRPVTSNVFSLLVCDILNSDHFTGPVMNRVFSRLVCDILNYDHSIVQMCLTNRQTLTYQFKTSWHPCCVYYRVLSNFTCFKYHLWYVISQENSELMKGNTKYLCRNVNWLVG